MWNFLIVFLQISSSGLTVSLLIVAASFFLRVTIWWILLDSQFFLGIFICMQNVCYSSILSIAFPICLCSQGFVSDDSSFYSVMSIMAVVGVVVCLIFILLYGES